MATHQSSDIVDGITSNAPAWLVGGVGLVIAAYAYIQLENLPLAVMVGFIATIALVFAGLQTKTHIETRQANRRARNQ